MDDEEDRVFVVNEWSFCHLITIATAVSLVSSHVSSLSIILSGRVRSLSRCHMCSFTASVALSAIRWVHTAPIIKRDVSTLRRRVQWRS